MLEKPKNYEEAKKIIVDAVDDELLTKKLKVAKLRAMLVVGAGVAGAIGLGIYTGDAALGAIAVPTSFALTSPFTLPYFLRKYTNERVRNGQYFIDVPKDKVMKAATDYVEGYNEIEKKKQRRLK